ncbi:MAG: sugar nucleotide-binding protein, partial [Deltaproteobacteria bacterium]|nr:sugar nucleotide-binding protein [Nannocystaceae bacterium]
LGELPRAASVQPWAVLATSDLAVRGTRPLEGARLLALAHRCANEGITLVTFSTDEVFGGDAEAPHCESETPTPDLPHGRERHDLERALLAATRDLLLVRTGVLLEPGVVDDGFMRVLSALRSGARLRVPDDEIVSLSSVPHLLDATLDLLIDGERGVWHGTHRGAASLFELSRRVAELAGAEPGSISAGRALHPWGLESRPGMRALASDRAWPMPPMAVALAEHVAAAALARRDPSAA